MKEFLHMGGYAFYVWSAYAIALVVLLYNLVSPIVARRRLLASLARRQQRMRERQS
jgi:heme exporter protein D